MPADGNQTQLMAAIEDLILGQPRRPVMREHQNFRTIFTTLDHSDAISAGWEEPEQELGEGGGYAVHFDGRGSQPTVHLELADGQVVGFHAIRELRKALEAAEKMAERMTGRS